MPSRTERGMTGFWTPLWTAIKGVHESSRNALIAAAPAWVRPKLAFQIPAQVLTVHTAKDLHASDIAPGYSIRIELPVEDVLHHRFIVPRVAAHELRRICRLEVARVMPLAADKLVYSFRPEADRQSGDLAVELFVVRRSQVEGLLQAARDQGVAVSAVGISGARHSADFTLPILARKRLLSVGAIFASLMFAFYVASTAPDPYLAKLSQAIEKVDEDIRLARANTAKIAGLQRQVQKLETLSSAIERVGGQSQIVDLFDAVTNLSPDDLVVDEFRLDDRKLFLSGYAKNPEDWVIELQRSNAFENVRLTSVLSADGERQRFDVVLSVRWPSERGGANVD